MQEKVNRSTEFPMGTTVKVLAMRWCRPPVGNRPGITSAEAAQMCEGRKGQ